MLPTEKEAEEFLKSADPTKRAKLIDRLLTRPEFAELWALKFTELFRAGTREAGDKAARHHLRVHEASFMANKPYDKIVTELLLSQGPHLYGTGSFWNVTFDSNAPDHATNISQIFLGTRIECAKCHNHPWEKWTQDDFYGFAAFFARVKIKEIHDDDENEHYYAEEGEVIHPEDQAEGYAEVSGRRLRAGRTGEGHPRAAGRVDDVAEESVLLAGDRQPRLEALSGPRPGGGRGRFSRHQSADESGPARRVGQRFFRRHGYDLKHLIRTILNSRTYQLSAEPNESNRADTLNYSHYFMRRMMAEQMLDTISQVTGVPEKFRGYPPGTRAMQVYSASRGPNYMLSAFGRPNRDTICERESMPGYRPDAAPDQRRDDQQEDRPMEAGSGSQ